MWHLMIDGQDDKSLSSKVTIEAENWFLALQKGLAQLGEDPGGVSHLSCAVVPERRVTITDSKTDATYRLERADGTDGAEKRRRDSDDAFEAVSLPSHTVFLMRDELSDDASHIFYRERLLAVESDLPTASAARLATHYFDQLYSLGTLEDSKRFLTVQIYDHVFEKKAERPAIAALSWKEWHGGRPEIFFPQSGETAITYAGQAASDMASDDAAIRHESMPEDERADDAYGVSDTMVTAFERMQDIFLLRHHDEAAAFVLSLARELISCESGSCVLMSPGKYEFYVSAVEGPGGDVLRSQRLSFGQGLIGFTAKSGVVVSVSAPNDDARFDIEREGMSGSDIRNLLLAPLQYEGQNVGVIELLNSTQDDGFSADDANILSYLGTSFAEYICTSLPSREPDFTDKDFSRSGKRVRRTKQSSSSGRGGAAKTRSRLAETRSKKTASKKASQQDTPAQSSRSSAKRKKSTSRSHRKSRPPKKR